MKTVVAKKRTRNVKWDKVELILALDLYLNHESNTKRGSTQEKNDLSDEIRLLNVYGLKPLPDNYRNFKSIGSKLDNFGSLDNADSTAGRSNGGNWDAEIWNALHEHPETVHFIAQAIRYTRPCRNDLGRFLTEYEDAAAYPDGIGFYVMHRIFENDADICLQTKERALEKGSARCYACGFDFGQSPNDSGAGLIECHHTMSFMEYRRWTRARPEEMVLVCPTCHRKLHRGQLQLNSLLRR